MSTSSRQRPPSFPSTVSLTNPTSSFRRPPPPVTTVVTSPRQSSIRLSLSSYIYLCFLAWARDEPPSPTEQMGSIHERTHPNDSRMSDVASFQSNPSEAGSRWWTFTPLRTRPETFDLLPSSQKPEKKTFRDISLSWMPTSSSQREAGGLNRKDQEKDPETANPHLSIPMPVQLFVPNTVAHTNTPGWDTPWTSRSAAQGPVRHSTREDSYELQDDHSSDSNKDQSPWSRRRKQLRSFILVNTYVPLVGVFPPSFNHCNSVAAFQIHQHCIHNSGTGDGNPNTQR